VRGEVGQCLVSGRAGISASRTGHSPYRRTCRWRGRNLQIPVPIAMVREMSWCTDVGRVLEGHKPRDLRDRLTWPPL
jgi:hypothetical protein